mmetsp:Transcript_4336/g.10805  ORF Transcript_4336/g.10805 Transcript_4336/m.10805 type:complete len:219 (-) Transcript_4336:170-826(-)
MGVSTSSGNLASSSRCARSMRKRRRDSISSASSISTCSSPITVPSSSPYMPPSPSASSSSSCAVQPWAYSSPVFSAFAWLFCAASSSCGVGHVCSLARSSGSASYLVSTWREGSSSANDCPDAPSCTSMPSASIASIASPSSLCPRASFASGKGSGSTSTESGWLSPTPGICTSRSTDSGCPRTYPNTSSVPSAAVPSAARGPASSAVYACPCDSTYA